MLECPDYEMTMRDIGPAFEAAPWRVELLAEPDFNLPPVPLAVLAEQVKRSISGREDTQLMEVISDGHGKVESD